MSANAELRRLPILEAHGLDVTVAGQPLLRGADFQVGRGELVVLVGASGTGKTVLLKLIAGIAGHGRQGFHVSGQLTFDGEDLLAERIGGGRIGILFQDHALFDEWTALANVQFARDHAARKKEGAPAPRDLLEELGIPPHARLRTMSGGQLQRLALARTLALAPELLLYDEPTTGLDVKNAERAAGLIQQAHREHGCTSLVVTHDTATLAPIADRVLLLDPATGTIDEVAPDQVEQALRSLPAAPLLPERALPRSTSPRATVRFLEGTVEVLRSLLGVAAHLVPLYPRPRHGLRSLLHGLRLTASAGAFAYIGIAGLILGYVSTYFTFEHLPKRGFTEPLFVDDILRALGYLTWRVLAPVLTTLLIAARTGAAISSDVGNKVYARQFDALRSFGVRPSRYHLTSALWAMLISAPLLLLVSFVAAKLASLCLFIFGHPDQTYFFWDQNYHRSLRLPDAFWWRGSGWLLLKVELCALGTGAIAYFEGARQKMAASDVSRAVTRTIILASLFVLGVHFALAFFEF